MAYHVILLPYHDSFVSPARSRVAAGTWTFGTITPMCFRAMDRVGLFGVSS